MTAKLKELFLHAHLVVQTVQEFVQGFSHLQRLVVLGHLVLQVVALFEYFLQVFALGLVLLESELILKLLFS